MLTQLIGTEVNPVMVDGVYRLLNRRPELALMPIMIFNESREVEQIFRFENIIFAHNRREATLVFLIL